MGFHTSIFSLSCFVSTFGQKVETGKYRTGNYGTHLSLHFARIVVAFPMGAISHLNPTIFSSTLFFSEDVLSYTVHVTIPRRKHLTWCRSRMQALVVQEQDWALSWETVHPPPPRQFRGIETAKVLNWIPRYWRVYIDTTSFLVTVWKHFNHILLKLHLAKQLHPIWVSRVLRSGLWV